MGKERDLEEETAEGLGTAGERLHGNPVGNPLGWIGISGENSVNLGEEG